MDDIVLCAKIAVECVENNLANVRNGEPKYLGFVFDVRREEAEDMMDFVSKTLKEYNIPINEIYVYCSISLPIVKVWTKQKILNEIKHSAEYLTEKRNFNSK